LRQINLYIISNGRAESVKLLGPKDFEYYEYNRPSQDWELVEFEDGKIGWIGNIWLFNSLEEAYAAD
jgi:hypothetical protein